MNFKTTYLLFAVLLGVLAIFGLTQLFGIKSPNDKTAWVISSLNDNKNPVKAADIDNVVIERKGPKPQTLTFYRSEQGWKHKEPSVRVDGSIVDRLIGQV